MYTQYTDIIIPIPAVGKSVWAEIFTEYRFKPFFHFFFSLSLYAWNKAPEM